MAHPSRFDALLRQRFPDSPWLWREDWQAGRIEYSEKSNALGLLLLGGFLLAICLVPVFIYGKESSLAEWVFFSYFLFLMFGFAGLMFVAYGVRSLLSWIRFGVFGLELTTVPGPIGGQLRGVLHTHTRFGRIKKLKIRLSCLHRRVVESGDSERKDDRVLWRSSRESGTEDEARLQPYRSFPVCVEIPRESPPTTVDNRGDHILWLLQASCGWGFKAEFEVPVFPSDRRLALQPVADLPGDDEIISRLGVERPSHPVVQVLSTAAGGTEYVFPTGRHRPIESAFATVFLLFAVPAVACFFIPEGLPFALLFALFALPLLVAVLHTRQSVTRVVVESGRLTIARKALGRSRERWIDCEMVERVNAKGLIHEDEGALFWFRLMTRLPAGGDVGPPPLGERRPPRRRGLGWRHVACAVMDFREAEWLAREMTQSIEANR